MNGQPFDALVRTLFAGSSRRGLLAAVTSGLVASLVHPLAADETEAKRRRRRKKKNKRGAGSPTSPPPIQPTPCQGGERLCPEGICVPVEECCLQEKACNGGCIPVEECCGGCATGQTCCPSPRIGICVDLQNDPFNCGICTRQCPNLSPGSCVNGQCVP
jgi:hypothetical protein